MRLPLDSSREGSHDIRIYLRERLDEIRHKPKFRGVEFPNPWPPPGAVEKLAQKASRQFLYASTVIAFVDGEFSEPCGRLEVILNLKPNLDADSPFRPLDVLYEHVLSVNPNRDQVVTILGFIVCSLSQTSIFATPNNIELLLNLPRGQVMLALRGMHSVLHIPGPHFPVEILHASFTEFLLDKSRSGFFYVGQAHFRSFAALHVVRYLNKNLFVLKRSPLELKSASLLSVVWDQWHALCLDVEKPTEELLSEIERLDWKAMYGIQTQLAIWNFSTDGDWSKEWRSFLYVFPEILQNLCSKEPNTLVERFAAGREGFHVSVSSSSSPSVLNVALAALAAGAWNLREHWFHSLFRDLTARWGDRLQRVRDEVRVIHLQRCPKCTSTLHHTPAPTECSSGIFYVRTQHIFASMLSTLIGLVRSPDTSTPTSDTTSEAIGALLTPRALYPQAECLLTLAGPVPELIPLMQEVFSKVLECQGVYLVEEMLVNLLGWLEVFPEDPEPGTDSLVRRIRDWAVSTKRKARGGFRQLYYNDLCEKLQLSQEPDV
ncbi:hypothetical protein V5O48_005735 [Marasmius crinis-equi]|uniref:Uncharacterized protein n=1 Tax=Marasmius crinis-equi TaxID=585013 RepID=A0ABR3FLI2_9AGAR